MNKYDGLELSLIKKEVAKEATFSRSYDYILNEEVSFNPIVIKNNISKTREALKLIKNSGRFSFDELKDISDSLLNLNKGLTLTSNELIDILEHNATIKRIIRYFKNISLDELEDYTASLYYNDELINEISLKININGEIKDNATTRLAHLKEKLLNIDNIISEKAKEFIKNNANSMQEALIYTRNNRACFLIKNTDKNKYDGFSYGNSASGLATYIEPKVMIELNNQKSDLLSDIKEEVAKILYDLSMKVLKDVKFFSDNLESIMILDAIFAKANYGFIKGGILADIVNDNLYLKDIAHPLIDEKKVVINTYEIKEPIRSIVISGSNTGGKTVSLKVIGVSVLMTYLGIPLIASEARIPLFDEVYIDINDSQSIIDSLSTFSSRLVSLNNILNKLSNRSLVLIDEIASGTDPKEGEALALAILEYLENKKCMFVITTHFSKVKKYALAANDMMLASQSFDSNKLIPTYKYIENSLGQSNGLEIASRYLDLNELLNRAKELLKINENEEEKLLNILEEEKQKLLKKEELINQELAKQKKISLELEERINNFEKNKIQLEEEAKHQIDLYIEKQKEKAKKIINRLKEENIKEHEAILVTKELESLFIKSNNNINNQEFNINDTVMILSTSQVGKIETIKGDKVTVIANGITLKTTKDNLEKCKTINTIKKKHYEKTYTRVNKEIVLVGKRCEEALELLAKYLDDAYGANMNSVRVVHGYGTGVLRNAIHEYLKKAKIVKKYHLAEAYDGGGAITIVEFK